MSESKVNTTCNILACLSDVIDILNGYVDGWEAIWLYVRFTKTE